MKTVLRLIVVIAVLAALAAPVCALGQGAVRVDAGNIHIAYRVGRHRHGFPPRHHHRRPHRHFVRRAIYRHHRHHMHDWR
jgi:hypothetical protein